ncbi:MAG: hypothetical protein JWQ04_1812, partial [Pedosphaera sp.]|nr:hypothetical protein [Pedosphaera sp.]
HSNPTNADTFGNGLPDGWQWNYFGNFNQTAAGDYDGDGVNNGMEYTNGTDPNKIQFTMLVTNRYFGSNLVPVQLNIISGVPSSMAVVVNDTNFAAANWQPYPGSNCFVSPGTNDGVYTVWLGLRGRLTNSQQAWAGTTLIRDTLPPVITITNPTVATVSKPFIQVQGYVSETLASFTYSLSNAAGLLTNQTVCITGQHVATNTWAVTTNYFQAYDVPLTNGINTLTLHATDLAGNVTTTNLVLTLDYSGDTNAPAITVTYPLTSSLVAGTNFTLLGSLDDDTATLTVSNAALPAVAALVERGGKFSVSNLPLPNATNLFTLTATDAAGNATNRTITVLKSSVTLTVDPLTDHQLAQPTLTLTGTLSDTNQNVWVNGTAATLTGNAWSMVIPAPAGTALNALVQAGSSLSSPSADLAVNQFMPPTIQTTSFTESYLDSSLSRCSPYDRADSSTRQRTWTLGEGGSSTQQTYDSISGSCVSFVAWPTNWPDGQGLSGTTTCNSAPYGEGTPAVWQYCSVQTKTYFAGLFNDCGAGTSFSDSVVNRQAQTRVQLVAGGPATIGVQKLIRLTASAATYSSLNASLDGGSPGDTPVAGSQIQLMGRTLTLTATNANVGEIFLPMQSDATQDIIYAVVNPNGAPLTNYSFTIQAEEVKLQVTGNGIVLDPSNTNNVEFCVGQKVDFQVNFFPAVAGLSSTNITWLFTVDYINNHFIASTGCEIYNIAPYWVAQNPTQAWFYKDKQHALANVGLNCTFTNGQTAYIVAQGMFNVYRPTISVNDITARHFSLTGSLGIYKLKLGEDDNVGSMRYDATYTSDYIGQGLITQLCTLDYSGPGPTFSDYRLDGTEAYEQGAIIPGTSSIFLTLQDGPSNVDTLPDRIKGSFKDYIRFRPNVGNTNDNIYITLGIVSWSMNATATNSTTISPNDTPDPVGPDNSNDFPFWNSSYP